MLLLPAEEKRETGSPYGDELFSYLLALILLFSLSAIF
jgi:hypothetical protein